MNFCCLQILSLLTNFIYEHLLLTNFLGAPLLLTNFEEFDMLTKVDRYFMEIAKFSWPNFSYNFTTLTVEVQVMVLRP